jgi:hypothetical protein
MNIGILSKFHPNLKIPRRNSIKFYQILNLDISLNFHLNSISNLKKFLWRKLLVSSKHSQPYFISNFLISVRSCLNKMKFERV